MQQVTFTWIEVENNKESNLKFFILNRTTEADKHQLSVDKFMGRSCALLVILFCLIAIIGYIDLPFNIPIHFKNGLPDRFSNKVQVFILPAICMLVYLLVNHFERYVYKPVKNSQFKRPVAYYRSLSKLIGFFKLVVLFSGIIITAGFVHHALNIGGVYDWKYSAMAALLIPAPVVFMLTEIKNIKDALIARR